MNHHQEQEREADMKESLDDGKNTTVTTSSNVFGGHQLGWIAEEVEKVLPELVHEDEDGWKAIHYSRAVTLVVEAMKDMKSEYEQRISSLEQRLLRLEQLCSGGGTSTSTATATAASG